MPMLVLMGAVVVTLAGILSLVSNVVGIWDRVRTKPPLHRQFASHDDLSSARDAVHKRVDGVEGAVAELVQQFQQDRRDQAAARRYIHKRINKILYGLARIYERSGLNSEELTRDEAED